jgi:negative regulator of sigma E activity
MHNYDDELKPKTVTSIPPPSIGYWGWIKYELKSKADEKWVVSELRALRRSFDDTKSTVTDVRKVAEKPYECKQMKEIDKLKDWQYKVMSWKIPAVISLVVLILGAAGQYFSLKDSVEDGNQAREEVQKTLKHIQVQQAETSKAIVEIKEQATISEIERRRDMEDFAKQVAKELKPEPVPARATRRSKRDSQ